jgi:hypothetical protein
MDAKVCITMVGMRKMFDDLPLASQLRRSCAIILSIPHKPFAAPECRSASDDSGRPLFRNHVPVPKPRRLRGSIQVERRKPEHRRHS